MSKKKLEPKMTTALFCNSTALFYGEKDACNLTAIDNYDIMCIQTRGGGIYCSLERGIYDYFSYLLAGFICIIMYIFLGKGNRIPDLDKVAWWEFSLLSIKFIIDILIN